MCTKEEKKKKRKEKEKRKKKKEKGKRNKGGPQPIVFCNHISEQPAEVLWFCSVGIRKMEVRTDVLWLLSVTGS